MPSIAFSKNFFDSAPVRNVRESVIEGYLVTELNRLRRQIVPPLKVLVKKIGGPGWRGWPDRMVLFDGGATHWLEVKRPRGGRYEPLQLRMHRELRKKGFVVRVVNTKALVDAYIVEIIRLGPHGLPPGEPICLKAPPNSSAKNGTTATVAVRLKQSSISSKTLRASKA